MEVIVDNAARGANVVIYLDATVDTLADDEITMIAMIGIAIVLPLTTINEDEQAASAFFVLLLLLLF